MLKINLREIEAIVNDARRTHSLIQPESMYRMEQLTHIREFYQLLFDKICFETSNRFTCYLPRTKQAAFELWNRNQWGFWIEQWKIMGRSRPASPPGFVYETMYPEPVKGHTLLAEWGQLKYAFETDLSEILVFELDGEEAEYYNHTGHFAFDAAVLDKYPAIRRDIQSAGHSVALEGYTGAVFHLCRATEIVTQDLAARYGITPDFPDRWQPDQRPKRKAWGDYIGALEWVIGTNTGNSQVPDEEERAHLSGAVVASRRLKNLRNNTDHIYMGISEFYDKDEAISIWKRTKEFIDHAAQTF